MTAEFYKRLKEYYMNVGSVLRGEADAASIFPNPTDIGMSREKIYADFLRLHLPSNCNVLFGGFIFNLEGFESKQIDLIINSNSCIKFDLNNRDGKGKTFACIEGTIAVASLKSNLTSSELEDALNNLASIPPQEPLGNRANPLIRIPNYERWPFKIIYAPKGAKIKTILDSINNFYESNPSIPVTRRPDIIHVAGNYNIILTSEQGVKTRDGTEIPANTFHYQPDPTDVFGLTYAILEIQKRAITAQSILFTYNKILDNMSF